MIAACIPPKLQSEAAAVIGGSADVMERIESVEQSAWATFVPRPDRPDLFDEQESFCRNQDRVAFLIGGNAAGTTEAAAWKAAQFLLNTPPPRPDTPYWVICNTYEQTCGVCWGEKLYGHGHIPDCEVDWERVRWIDTVRGWPAAVPLLPWPGRPGKNWVLEFKSYEQGRRAMQARSLGGFWFSEQFPVDIFTETIRGCRDYMYPGGQIAEFTPVEPELCLWIEAAMDEQPKGWRFYRCNTECNRANLAEGWLEDFLVSVPEEMRETRLTGALATFEGVIFSSFNVRVHVIDEQPIPAGVHHYMGIDWGASEEHPFACVWGYRDGVGDWTIYDEYWSTSQSAITVDHATEIAKRCIGWGWPGKLVKPKAEQKSRLIFAAAQSGLHHEAFADPSRPGEINEFVQRGIETSGAATNVYKGIDCLRSLMQPRPPDGRPKFRVHRRCKHLIQELRKYRWLRGKKPTAGTILNPQVAAPRPLMRDNDTVDAARYMIYTSETRRGMLPGSASHRDPARRSSIQLSRKLTPKSEGWFQG